MQQPIMRETTELGGKRPQPGFVNVVTTVPCHICLSLHAAFTQPVRSLLADSQTRQLTPGVCGGVGVAHLEELGGRPDVEEEEEGERQHRREQRVQTHVVNPAESAWSSWPDGSANFSWTNTGPGINVCIT